MRAKPAALLFLLFITPMALLSCASIGEGYLVKTTKNIVFKTVDGVELKGDIYSAENISGPKPAVVVVHGGGWFARLGDMTGVCRSLAKAGFVAFNVTYRLAPKYHYPAPVEDLHDALEWLKINGAKYDIDPQRISGWGSPPVPI